MIWKNMLNNLKTGIEFIYKGFFLVGLFQILLKTMVILTFPIGISVYKCLR